MVEILENEVGTKLGRKNHTIHILGVILGLRAAHWCPTAKKAQVWVPRAPHVALVAIMALRRP